jgi:hypothetical protein
MVCAATGFASTRDEFIRRRTIGDEEGLSLGRDPIALPAGSSGNAGSQSVNHLPDRGHGDLRGVNGLYDDRHSLLHDRLEAIEFRCNMRPLTKLNCPGRRRIERHQIRRWRWPR